MYERKPKNTIRLKELFESIVLAEVGDGFLLFLKHSFGDKNVQRLMVLRLKEHQID